MDTFLPVFFSCYPTDNKMVLLLLVTVPTNGLVGCQVTLGSLESKKNTREFIASMCLFS